MSDAPQGPDWWQAADDRWYPPQQAAPPPGSPPPPGAAPGYPPPGYPPPDYPAGGPPPKSKTTPVLIGCLVAVVTVPVLAVIAIAAVTLLGRSASSKFSSVGTAIPSPTTTGAPRSKTPGAAPGLTPGASITGVTPCPAADGSSPRTTSFAQPPPMCIDPSKTYTAQVSTTKGDFTITLDPRTAPLATNNFVVLSRYHFYDGVPFHRVIPDFVVQGGDATGNPAGTGDPGYSFPDELPRSPSLYKTGTVAMANSGPDTNGSQFYIVVAEGKLGAQYSIFGQVTEGYDTTVKAIEAGGSASGAPIDPTAIKTIAITES